MEHRHRDQQRQTALEFGTAMRASKTPPYSQAKQTLKESGLWVSSDDFYNLERSLDLVVGKWSGLCGGYYRYELSASGWEVGASEIYMFSYGGYSV